MVKKLLIKKSPRDNQILQIKTTKQSVPVKSVKNNLDFNPRQHKSSNFKRTLSGLRK